VLIPTRDHDLPALDVRFAKACMLPTVCDGTRAVIFSVRAVTSSLTPDLPEALTSSGTVLLGGYQLGTPEHGMVLAQDPQGAFSTIEVPGLSGRILDLAYDHHGEVILTSTTGRLFALDAKGHPIPTASAAFSSQPVGVSAGIDGTVVAYSSTAAVFVYRSGLRAPLPALPPGVISLAVRTSTDMVAVAVNPVDQVPTIYTFDGSTWTRSYDGPELALETDHPIPRPTAGRGRWAVIGPNGIVTRIGKRPWSPVTYPFPPHQPLTGTFLSDGTLIVGGTLGTAGALSGDGSWCNSIAIGEPIWLTHLEVSSDGTLAVFSTQQGFGGSPTVIRVAL
jgi:hypothetical protein